MREPQREGWHGLGIRVPALARQSKCSDDCGLVSRVSRLDNYLPHWKQNKVSFHGGSSVAFVGNQFWLGVHCLPRNYPLNQSQSIDNFVFRKMRNVNRKQITSAPNQTKTEPIKWVGPCLAPNLTDWEDYKNIVTCLRRSICKSESQQAMIWMGYEWLMINDRRTLESRFYVDIYVGVAQEVEVRFGTF